MNWWDKWNKCDQDDGRNSDKYLLKRFSLNRCETTRLQITWALLVRSETSCQCSLFFFKLAVGSSSKMYCGSLYLSKHAEIRFYWALCWHRKLKTQQIPLLWHQCNECTIRQSSLYSSNHRIQSIHKVDHRTKNNRIQRIKNQESYPIFYF